MKIEIGKTYICQLGYKVTIVASDPTITSPYHFIGSNVDNGLIFYRNYNSEGFCNSKDGGADRKLILEFGRKMGFPETDPPLYGTLYHFPVIDNTTLKTCSFIWSDDGLDNKLLSDGLVFLDEQDAQQASEIIIKLFKEYNEHRKNTT